MESEQDNVNLFLAFLFQLYKALIKYILVKERNCIYFQTNTDKTAFVLLYIIVVYYCITRQPWCT